MNKQKEKVQDLEIVQITLKAQLIGEFYNYLHWYHRDRYWQPHGLLYGDQLIFVDSDNNIVSTQHDFHRAEEIGTYPIKAYRLAKICDLPF